MCVDRYVQVLFRRRFQLAQSMGRKGKLGPEQRARVCRALAASSGSENNTLQIYNALQDEEEDQLKPGLFKRLVRRRLEPASACFEEHLLPGYEEGAEVSIFLPKFKELLEFYAAAAPDWAEALLRCLEAQRDSAMRIILYSDDVTCGNILAPRKSKKFTLFYIGVAQMRGHLHHAGTWLLGACAQYAHVERVQGGISAVAARLVRCILNDVTRAGFPLTCRGRSQWVRVCGPIHFLGDHEAQRAIYHAKGSAAICPCLQCCNVACKGFDDLPAGWTTITDHHRSNFMRRTDAEIFEALDELCGLNGKELETQEKALGFCCIEGAITLDQAVRHEMPPLLSCNEVLHDYFANGIACLELALLRQALQAQASIRLEEIKEQLVAERWHRSGEGRSFAVGTLRRLLHPKCWEEEKNKEKYKGDGNECHSVVYLFNYIQWQHLPAGPNDVRDSFQLLAEVCRELRALQYQVRPLRAGDTTGLDGLQGRHLQAFVQAWGASRVKPKHHHAMHIGQAGESLGMLPHVGIQEKKHQELKASLIDQCEGGLGDPRQIQQTLIPRLLQQSADSICKHGLSGWGLAKDGVSAADADMRRELDDDRLEAAKEASCFMRGIAAGDVLMCHNMGGQVETAVEGPKAGFFLGLRKLELLERKPWGSVWRNTGRRLWFKPDPAVPMTLAAWWCTSSGYFLCLH